MLLHDYSQLPVLTGDRTVKGMVSWRSIGKAFAINRGGSEVREFIEPGPKIRELSTPLLDDVADVIRYEVILVRDQSKRIVGLVTSTDLSELLKEHAEAFLRIGEIEHIYGASSPLIST
jgi:predicted transcriptional regulator